MRGHVNISKMPPDEGIHRAALSLPAGHMCVATAHSASFPEPCGDPYRGWTVTPVCPTRFCRTELRKAELHCPGMHGSGSSLASSGAGGALLHQYKHEMLPHTPAVSRSFPYGKGTWVCGYSQELGIYSILPCSSFSKNLYFASSISVILLTPKFRIFFRSASGSFSKSATVRMR